MKKMIFGLLLCISIGAQSQTSKLEKVACLFNANQWQKFLSEFISYCENNEIAYQ